MLGIAFGVVMSFMAMAYLGTSPKIVDPKNISKIHDGEPVGAEHRKGEQPVRGDAQKHEADRSGRLHEEMFFVEMSELGMVLQEVEDKIAEPEGTDAFDEGDEVREKIRHDCS
jgi:hypothetical protein